MEFTAADIFQCSPFGDILNSLKSLSLSGEPRPNYGLRSWDSGDEEIQSPPTTHLIATVEDLTDMLEFGSEQFDGMDDEYGDEPEPSPVGRWTSTIPNDVFMVDTPENINNEEKGAKRRVNPPRSTRNGDVNAELSPASIKTLPQSRTSRQMTNTSQNSRLNMATRAEKTNSLPPVITEFRTIPRRIKSWSRRTSKKGSWLQHAT